MDSFSPDSISRNHELTEYSFSDPSQSLTVHHTIDIYTLQKKLRFNLFEGVNLIETEANIVNVKTTNFYQRSF